MNFKLTKVKVICSIVIAIFIWLLTYTATLGPKLLLAPILTLLSLVLVYIIWSLFQKKNISKRKKK
jgi:hypothetical protein